MDSKPIRLGSEVLGSRLGPLRWQLRTSFAAASQQLSGARDLLEQVLDDVLAVDEVGALDAFVGEVTRIRGLPKGH